MTAQKPQPLWARVAWPCSLLGVLAIVLFTTRPAAYNLQVAILFTGATQEKAGPRVLGLSASVHGELEKTGAPDQRWWHESSYQQRVKDFFEWVDASSAAANASSAAAAHGSGGAEPPVETPPVIFPFCDPYVSHAYKLIYIRCPKTASSSLLSHFTPCEQGRHHPWCLQPLNRTLPAEELAAIWRDYYVFAFTRSPFSRALSTYKFLTEMVVDSPECGSELSWDAFCADPALMGRACHAMPPHCCLHGDGFMFHHTVEQARCLTTPDGGWAVDFLGRVEHMREDLEEMLEALKPRHAAAGLAPMTLSPEVPTLNQGGKCGEAMEMSRLMAGSGGGSPAALRMAPEQYCNREEYFSGRHAHCVARIAHYYETDLGLLGIDPAGLA